MFKKIKNFFHSRYQKHNAYKKDNRDREVAVYVVLSTQELKDRGFADDVTKIDFDKVTPITFTSTMAEAVAAVDRLYYIRRGEHYKGWCNLRNVPENERGFHTVSWAEYEESTETGVRFEEDYQILQLIYTIADVANLLRLESNCAPLFLPFEREGELRDYFITQFQRTQRLVVPGTIMGLMALDPDIDRVVHEHFDTVVKELKDSLGEDSLRINDDRQGKTEVETEENK